jgi:ABC-type polysaccharide/polyol phosphate export permease
VGYRDSFLWGVGFWSKPIETAIYWSITLLMLVIGIFTFKKLRSQFADVV